MRWVKSRRGDVTHRYFRRRANADAFASKLRGKGKCVAVFTADTAWTVLD